MSVSHISHSAAKHAATSAPHTRSTVPTSTAHAPTHRGSTSLVQPHPAVSGPSAHVVKAPVVTVPKTTPSLATSGPIGTRINTTA